MDTGPAFWLIITIGAIVLLGVALAYGLISKRKRRYARNNPAKRHLHGSVLAVAALREDPRR